MGECSTTFWHAIIAPCHSQRAMYGCCECSESVLRRSVGYETFYKIHAVFVWSGVFLFSIQTSSHQQELSIYSLKLSRPLSQPLSFDSRGNSLASPHPILASVYFERDSHHLPPDHSSTTSAGPPGLLYKTFQPSSSLLNQDTAAR